MRVGRIAVVACGAAGVLLACVGSDPPSTTTTSDAGDADGALPPVAASDADVVADAFPPSDADAALPDAGAEDPCATAGPHDDGTFCDDFTGVPVDGGAAIDESFWSKKLSDVGALDIFPDPGCPSPPSSLRAKLTATDATARAASVSHVGPPGYTSVSCAVSFKQAVGAGTGVRLFQILLRRGGLNARELTAYLDTTGPAPVLDMIITEIVTGQTPKATHLPKKPAVLDDWATLELGFKTNHAAASYAGASILDAPLAQGDFDDAQIELGLLSFDQAGTRASSVRYDNLRCRFSPP